MKCFSCNQDKLSNEFPTEISPGCQHAPTWCIKCCVEHFTVAATCPVCPETLSEEQQDAIRHMMPFSHVATAVTGQGTSLFVSLLGGDTISILYSDDMLISQLRDEIEKLLSVSARKQRLSIDGHILADTLDRVPQTVRDYGIVAGQHVNLMVTPYTQYAGQNVITSAPKDAYGNAAGAEYDLGEDGAFNGHTVAVLHFYTGEGFDFVLPEAALVAKGFTVRRWTTAPNTTEFASVLETACQLWIIPTSKIMLSSHHVALVAKFFNRGGGVFLWADNDPYSADCPALLQALFGNVTLSGDILGAGFDLSLRSGGGTDGFESHLVTTGIQALYSGATVASVGGNFADLGLVPLLFGNGNVISATFDQDGKRAMIDGGFTRVMPSMWERTAGTARFVKNAAAWLANVERMMSEGRF